MKIEKENLFRSVALLLLCVMIAQPLIDFSEIFQDQVTYAWEIDWNTDTDDEEEKEETKHQPPFKNGMNKSLRIAKNQSHLIPHKRVDNLAAEIFLPPPEQLSSL